MPDADFEAAGATMCASREETLAQAGVVLMVNPPRVTEVGGLPQGALLASLLQPDQSPELLEALAARGVNAIALDKIPRISRAQKMDVLSSMANIAGYRAIVEAASRYGGFFSGQITAAGRTPPAKVLVIGAGVAGLAAIASARALGAVVRAFDVRPAVKEQVESLGASFLELTFESDESGETAGGYAKIMSKEFIDAEMALFADQAREVDIIVTTALIPGKKAPTLITADMVASMRAGSVIVDLAAAQGGNVEGTVADSVEEIGGVQIVGFTDLTSRLPRHASQFFGTNLVNLLDDLGGAEDFKLDLEDLVVEQSLAVHDGAVRWPPPPLPPPPPKKEAVAAAPPPPTPKAKKKEGGSPWPVLALAVILTALALVTPDDSVLVQQITVFILACFVGWQVVWSVSPALHTPLMSVTNAISGIILVGGMLQAGSGDMNLAAILGAVAILVASINIFGGFFVTHRMLAMFRKEG
jgi:NAD(P) transhydrogenase subunit alpha